MSEKTNEQKPSLWGIIWSPSVQFERIKEHPKIWGPLGIVTFLFIIGMWLQSFGLELELEGLSKEEKVIVSAISTVSLILAGIISPIFGAFISTLIYLLVAKIANSKVSFRQLFSMNTYLMIMSALSLIINGVGFALFGDSGEILYTSLGSMISAEGAMAGILSSIELFNIWRVILAAIGLHKVADFSKGLAWTVSIVLYLIGVIIAMVGAAASGVVGI